MVQQRIRNLTLDGGNGSGSDQMPGSATSCSVLIESFAFSCVTTDPDPTLRDWRKWIGLQLFREKWIRIRKIMPELIFGLYELLSLYEFHPLQQRIRIKLWIERNGIGSDQSCRSWCSLCIRHILCILMCNNGFGSNYGLREMDPDPTLSGEMDPDPTLDWGKWIRLQLFREKGSGSNSFGSIGSRSDQMPGSTTSCLSWCSVCINHILYNNGSGSNFGLREMDPDPTLSGEMDPDPTKCPDPLLLSWADVHSVFVTSFAFSCVTTDSDPIMDWGKWIRNTDPTLAGEMDLDPTLSGEMDLDPTLSREMDPDPTNCPDPLLLAWADVRSVWVPSFAFSCATT